MDLNESDDEQTKKMLIDVNQMLLNSIVEADYQTYDELCSETLSCMEPESLHKVVVGKEFHKFYFDSYGGGGDGDNEEDDAKKKKTTQKVTMIHPHVQLIKGEGDVVGAVLSYVKLTQRRSKPNRLANEEVVTTEQSETRVWEKSDIDGVWRNIHFHKSPSTTTGQTLTTQTTVSSTGAAPPAVTFYQPHNIPRRERITKPNRTRTTSEEASENMGDEPANKKPRRMTGAFVEMNQYRFTPYAGERDTSHIEYQVKMNERSEAWDYFCPVVEIFDKDKIPEKYWKFTAHDLCCCNICGEVVASTSGKGRTTANLRSHLKAKHKLDLSAKDE